MIWDGVIRLPETPFAALATRYGGRVLTGARETGALVSRLVPVDDAQVGDLAPLLASRFVRAARDAAARGAFLLVDATLEDALRVPGEVGERPPLDASRIWVHEHATWALADLLDGALVPHLEPVLGEGCSIAPSAVIGPRVVLGARVVVGPGAVIGHPGFGWAFAGERVRAIPQRAGVVIGDDVAIGPLSTVDAGTLSPTRIGRGVKLDAHVHVGHNVVIGEGTIVAAQCGFAGSVRIGRGVLVGGQVGIADHVVVGDGARIAAKSGVIGDVPPGSTVAGYPAVPRVRWLRALATIYGRFRPDGEV